MNSIHNHLQQWQRAEVSLRISQSIWLRVVGCTLEVQLWDWCIFIEPWVRAVENLKMKVEDPRCPSSWASGTAARSLWDVLVHGKRTEVPDPGCSVPAPHSSSQLWVQQRCGCAMPQAGLRSTGDIAWSAGLGNSHLHTTARSSTLSFCGWASQPGWFQQEPLTEVGEQQAAATTWGWTWAPVLA